MCKGAVATLSPLGRVLACLPTTQASAERVFSCASWLSDGRPRIDFETLAREMFIRSVQIGFLHCIPKPPCIPHQIFVMQNLELRDVWLIVFLVNWSDPPPPIT